MLHLWVQLPDTWDVDQRKLESKNDVFFSPFGTPCYSLSPLLGYLYVIAMGTCFSSHADKPKDAAETSASAVKSKTPCVPFTVTVAFPNVLPYNLTVSPNEKISKIRLQCVNEMQRRHGCGEDFVHVDGRLMTLNPDNGDAVEVSDSLTVKQANLENRQYLWFHDEKENTREADLILRSSRLNENRSHNSRGVKQGMAMMKAEEQTTS